MKVGLVMEKYKICVYAIAKNEEKFVERWMDSVSEADIVVVLDTGSTDGTVKKLEEKGAIVKSIEIDPWRFDVARNMAMDMIPEDVDICISNDLDEVFEPGWREKLESVWTNEYTRARYLFTWSYTKAGKPDKQFSMEKIHCRHGFRWCRPVHEVLIYDGSLVDKTVWVPDLVLNHYPDDQKSRSQYLPLLELAALENGNDDRIMFWLGREYMYRGMYDKCIETLIKHLDLETAKWDEERSASMRYIAHSYKEKKQYEETKKWLFKAIAECPRVREPYVDMAKLGEENKDWALMYAMVKEGLNITEKSGSYLVDPACWGNVLYDLGAISAYYLGLYEEAKIFAVKALEYNPNDERLKNNLDLIKTKINSLATKEVTYE